MSDTTEYPVDLSGYETAYGAAKKTATVLANLFEAENEVSLLSPEECEEIFGYGKEAGIWAVMWEAGPYEWAINLTGGMSLAYGEFPEFGASPEIVGFFEADNWTVEHHYSFDILFIPE